MSFQLISDHQLAMFPFCWAVLLCRHSTRSYMHTCKLPFTHVEPGRPQSQLRGEMVPDSSQRGLQHFGTAENSFNSPGRLQLLQEPRCVATLFLPDVKSDCWDGTFHHHAFSPLLFDQGNPSEHTLVCMHACILRNACSTHLKMHTGAWFISGSVP